MLFQPTNITPDELSGTGSVDLTAGLTVSWEVNGNSAMTAYEIVIYRNNTASTQLYTTGKVTLTTPFWGTNYSGERELFSVDITAAALSSANVVNGDEYKLLITQWWGSSNSTSITQMTAAVFSGHALPTVSIIMPALPLASRSAVFTASYTQAQNVPIKWVRWEIAEKDSRDFPFIDTGKIYGTGELKVTYDGFYTNTTYSIRCTIEAADETQCTSGWIDFAVSYSVQAAQGSIHVCQLKDSSAVFVEWDKINTANGYAIFRRNAAKNYLKRIAEVDATTGELRDYSARSGETYIYYVFPKGALAYLTEPLVSDPVSVRFWFWHISECLLRSDGTYEIIKEFIFRAGYGGVTEGTFSNNNSPEIVKNFTRYPTRHGETANYLTGSVSGFVGAYNQALNSYADTVNDTTALMELSTTEHTLFLTDPKGRLIQISTSAPITFTVEHKNIVMPQTGTVTWAEMQSPANVSIYSAIGGQFYPSDYIIATSITVNPQTGKLMWTVPQPYTNGSILSLNGDGELIQTADGAFSPASMEIDRAAEILQATIT